MPLFFCVFLNTISGQSCAPSDGAPGPYICYPYITSLSASTANFSKDFTPSGFCGTVENNGWFSFAPCQSSVVFSVITNSCENNQGLEAAIFDRQFNLVSNCYSSGGLMLGGNVIANGLTPGQIYYFMVDGYDGDECDFVITASEGVAPLDNEPPLQQPGYIIGQAEICNGNISEYTIVPPVCQSISLNACPLPNLSAYYDTTYIWDMPTGATLLQTSGRTATISWDDFQEGSISVTMEIIDLQNGCDACPGGMPDYACSSVIDDLEINIKDPYFQQLPTVQLCEGECFDMGGKSYCEPGNYQETFTAIDGCDSIVAFDIYIFQNQTVRLSDRFLCPGSCLLEAGEQFCEAGEYQIHLNSANGCDSMIIFEIFMLESSFEQMPDVNICEGECYEINGQTFCESGRYELDLTAANGCDSIVQFDLTVVKKSQTKLPLVQICEDDCYDFEGTRYCEEGTYEIIKSNQFGCDSIIQLEIAIRRKSQTKLPLIEICEDDCYDHEGTRYCDEGIYEIIKSDQNGCDSILLLEIKKLQKSTTTLPAQTLCEGDCFEINNTQYCQSGTYQINLQNQAGCDSVVTFEVKIRTLELNIPPSILLTPTEPTYQLEPRLNGSLENIKVEWSGFDQPSGAFAQTLDSEGIFVLNLTDTIVGCSTSDTIQVYRLYQPCKEGVFITAAPHCQSAPFICGEFLNGFCMEMDSFPLFTLSGNIQSIINDSIENPKWIRWSPCADTAVFRIAIKESYRNKGLALSVVSTSDCENYTPIINSYPIAPKTVEIIEIPDLIPGEIYYFLLDGIDKDICELQVEIVKGISEDPLEWRMITPPQITGDRSFCPGEAQTLTVVPPVCEVTLNGCSFNSSLIHAKPTNIRWQLPSNARIIGDSTGSSIEVIFDESSLLKQGEEYLPNGVLLTGSIGVRLETSIQLPDGVLCTNEDKCSFSEQLEIEVKHELNELPAIDICGDSNYAFCGKQINESKVAICREGCSTTIQRVTVHQPRKVDHGFQRLCPNTCYTMPITGIELCKAGRHTIPITDKCEGTESVVIDFYDKAPIVTGPTLEECNFLQTSYQVTFDILEGTMPYSIDGTAINGKTFTSQPIPSGEAYIFEITDSNICDEQTFVEGRYVCGPTCTSRAGTMQSSVLNVCSNEMAEPMHHQNIYLDSDDGLEYFLHTNPSDELGQIIARKGVNEFEFDANTMQHGATYYASAVVGTLVSGEIDLNDPCLSVAPGQPVVFHEQPTIDIADTFKLTCVKSEITLSAATLNEDVTYYWILPNGTTQLSPYLLATEPGQFEFKSVSAAGCSFSKTITIVEDYEMPIAEAGTEKELICTQPSVILDGSNSSEGDQFKYEWTTPDGIILSGKYTLNPRTDQPGIYFLSVKNIDNGCHTIDSVEVTQSEEVIRNATFNIRYPTCHDAHDGVIEVHGVQDGTPPYEYSFDGADFSTNPTFSSLQSGTYEILIRDANGCMKQRQIELPEPPPVSVELGDDIFITLGEQIMLTAATNILPTKVEWWNNSGETHSREHDWIVQPTESGTYQVRIEDNNGCFDEDQIQVIVKESAVFIPSAFSPNNDQKNDFFTVYAGESVKQITGLKIYSRNGELVFENTNFTPNEEQLGWDGFFRGKKMLPAVFAYVVEVEFINGDVKAFRGDLTLIP